MASFEQRSGKWRCLVFHAGRRFARTFSTEEEARAWGVEAKEKMRRGWRPKPLRHHRCREIAIPAHMALPTLTHDQIVSGALPYRRECGIYFLIRERRIVYVGQSVNVTYRIGSHHPKIKFDHVAFHFCQRKELDVLEAYYIKTLAPEHNVLCPNILA
jgi:hypothetical protein